MRRDKGFTLLELLIVVAISALLAAVGYRSIASNTPGQHLNAASLEFRSELNRVKTLALKNHVQYQVTVSGNSYTIWEGDSTSGSTFTADSTRTLGHPDITLTGGAFRFDPRGTAFSAGDITLTNNEGTTRTITLTLAGRLRSSI